MAHNRQEYYAALVTQMPLKRSPLFQRLQSRYVGKVERLQCLRSGKASLGEETSFAFS